MVVEVKKCLNVAQAWHSFSLYCCQGQREYLGCAYFKYRCYISPWSIFYRFIYINNILKG